MISVVVDDLAFVTADAIVRPASSSLEPTTAALRRLEQVGGAAFWEHLAVHDELPIGAAVVTGAGDLAADLVIHAIIRSATEPVTAAGVYHAVTNVWHRAADWQLSHIATPPLGTGAGNLSLEDAADVLCAAIGELAHGQYPHHVTIVVETEEEQAIFEARVDRLTS